MFPLLFKIGSFPLGTYGLFLALGLISAVWLAEKLGVRIGVPREKTNGLIIWALVSALVGSKVLMIIGDWQHFIKGPWDYFVDNLRSLGAFYGGFIGGVTGGAFYAWRHKMPWRDMLDVVAPALALAHALGRLGCFSAGCCYGKPTTLPWGISFPDHPFTLASPTGVPLHPTQLYEAFFLLVVFLYLYRTFDRRKFSGQLFCQYLGSYAVARFVVEFFRGDHIRGLWFGDRFSTSQLVAVPLFMAAFGLYLYLKKKGSLQPPLVEEQSP